MLRTGILNPAINSLLSRVRHTNTLVIADRGFPYWPQIETIDISLVDDIPTVLDVLRAIQANFVVGQFYMAEEFRESNSPPVVEALEAVIAGTPLLFERHAEFKRRIPSAIGLIRTADITPYANIILESA
ncbi:MAG: RbsD/FucU family protein [Bryobacteraceae bacterium]